MRSDILEQAQAIRDEMDETARKAIELAERVVDLEIALLEVSV